ncbi:DUF7946 domain-containing protein [Gluconobacter wancherniae]|uniref:DUF7946 domain-containing protein n=1 Tax=Gluconobacter wancherniae TaxID=1307955 RepID=UPI001B8B9AE9|nr:hypothetical protein [Gluconobacter wancherniae]MBS1089089.1 hypothetical protein [Gluconobacter wancherniae]
MHTTFFEISYEGALADSHEIDFYDISRALVGFQRTLSLTTHLLLNDQIITQSNALKGAKIRLLPPEEGSWTVIAMIGIVAWGGLSVSKDTVAGHLITSAYDYVIKAALGFHIDFEKTLGKQIDEEKRNNPKIKFPIVSRFDSLIEKCQVALEDMHRPIIFSETANSANVSSIENMEKVKIGVTLNRNTYYNIGEEIIENKIEHFSGNISGYNSNSFSGRVYIPELNRIIPFEVTESSRSKENIRKITHSLSVNAQRGDDHLVLSDIGFHGLKVNTKTGRLKRIILTDID